MTDCQEDAACHLAPLELYEKLTHQGDQVRALKSEKAAKVSIFMNVMF